MIQWVLNKGNFNREGENRTKIALWAGIVGLISNGILTLVKLILGWMSGSVSVMADAINNLMDSTSSMITIAGTHFAGKPADEDHPQGHGRIEYVTGMIISAFVMVVGLQFARTSIDRILYPIKTHFTPIGLVVLVLSIGVKFWQANFNKKIGESIDSSPLKATAMDSLGDCLVTGVVLVSIFLDPLVSFPVDGSVGLVVSILIMKSGWDLISQTLSELIGEAPSLEVQNELYTRMMSYDHVLGVHDMIFNSFGPEKTVVVLDAEFPADLSLVEVHEIIDQAEREISKEMDVHLIVHVDPIGGESPFERKIMKALDQYIRTHRDLLGYHDLSYVEEEKKIYVDITVLGHAYRKEASRDLARQEVTDYLEENFQGIQAVVDIDLEY